MFKNIFKTKKTNKKDKVVNLKPNRDASKKVRVFDVIKKPRVTDKSAALSKENVYIFEVRNDATKEKVSDAILAIYDVKPTDVRFAMSKTRSKRVRNLGPRINKYSKTPKVKKAYVQLKKGDKIQLA